MLPFAVMLSPVLYSRKPCRRICADDHRNNPAMISATTRSLHEPYRSSCSHHRDITDCVIARAEPYRTHIGVTLLVAVSNTTLAILAVSAKNAMTPMTSTRGSPSSSTCWPLIQSVSVTARSAGLPPFGRSATAAVLEPVIILDASRSSQRWIRRMTIAASPVPGPCGPSCPALAGTGCVSGRSDSGTWPVVAENDTSRHGLNFTGCVESESEAHPEASG